MTSLGNTFQARSASRARLDLCGVVPSPSPFPLRNTCVSFLVGGPSSSGAAEGALQDAGTSTTTVEQLGTHHADWHCCNG